MGRMSLKRNLYDDIQEVIDYRMSEIGYYDEDDTIILMLEDLQDALKRTI